MIAGFWMLSGRQMDTSNLAMIPLLQPEAN